jgi:ferredoxin-NADP reductase
VATISAPLDAARSWAGETGQIDRDMVRRHLPDGTSPIYYTAGPAAMVAAMRDMLKSMMVALQDARFEEFYGY